MVGYDIFKEPDKDKRLDGLIKILGTSISITGFVSIIVTIIQSRKTIQKDLQQSTIDLFKEFRSEKFKNTRDRVWGLMNNWMQTEGFKQKFIDYNFKQDNKKVEEELDKDIKALYDMLEFYLILSVYEGNENVLKALRYFYYGWYRHFLYDIAKEIESNRQVNPLLSSYKTSYLSDLSYVSNLERLDRLCGLDKIPKNTIIHFDGG